MVAELLRKFKGSLELVDARQFLPLFKARPGLSTWVVLNDYHAAKKDCNNNNNRNRSSYNQADAVAFTTASVEQSAVELTDAQAANESAPDASMQPVSADLTSAITDTALACDDVLINECLNAGFSYYPDCNSVPENLRSRVHSSLFPPCSEEAEEMHLGM